MEPTPPPPPPPAPPPPPPPPPPVPQKPPAALHAPEEAAKHVTIWNRTEHRKIAGNAAPLRRNLARYLKKHPDCEEYSGQDKDPNRRPIDPVTGRRILHLNEHVPIWHTLENRKVTGNAAPLRKNLKNYLRKHPHCEIYKNQDKAPAHLRPLPFHPSPALPHPSSVAHAQAHAHGHAPPTSTAPSRPAHPRHHPHHHQAPAAHPPASAAPPSSAPMRNLLYETMRYNSPPSRPSVAPKRSVAGAPPTPDPPPWSVHASCANGATQQPLPPVSHPATPSYSDMVSSWSNQPYWAVPFPAATPPSFGTAHSAAVAVDAPKPSSLFTAQHYTAAALDGPEGGINGIPIPGSIARDRGDVVMGHSMGTSLGTSAQLHGDIAHFLSATPMSMEHDPDMMQFSPSNYLSMGSLSGPSPPLPIPQFSSAHSSAALPHK